MSNILLGNEAYERGAVLAISDAFEGKFNEALDCLDKRLYFDLPQSYVGTDDYEKGWAMFYDGSHMRCCVNFAQLYGMLSAAKYEDDERAEERAEKAAQSSWNHSEGVSTI